MPKFIVTANKLNRRTVVPASLPDLNNIFDFVPKNFIFDAEEVSDNEMPTTVHDKWYKDDKGLFYWGGGINEIRESTIDTPTTEPLIENEIDAQNYINERFNGIILKEFINYNFLLNIPEHIKQTNGKDITVAILDHPISKSLKLKNDVIRPISIDHPASAHGTFIAGIIAGVNDILGVAPEVKIIELPIYDQNGFRKTELINRCFDFLDSFGGPLILNISQDFPVQFSDRITTLKNKIIVASAGIDSALIGTKLFFPASLSESISIGSISTNFRNTNKAPLFNKMLDFVLPDFYYASNGAGINQFMLYRGDSFATAVVSGIIALLLSAGKIDASLGDIKNELSNISGNYSDIKQFNFLNPINV